MTDRKAVIKNADMSEDMQQDAVDCATQAIEKYNIEKVFSNQNVFFFDIVNQINLLFYDYIIRQGIKMHTLPIYWIYKLYNFYIIFCVNLLEILTQKSSR